MYTNCFYQNLWIDYLKWFINLFRECTLPLGTTFLNVSSSYQNKNKNVIKICSCGCQSRFCQPLVTHFASKSVIFVNFFLPRIAPFAGGTKFAT